MSDEYNKEDIMLAAAFALGDEDLVHRIATNFPEHKLGMGLKKFCFVINTTHIILFATLFRPKTGSRMSLIYFSEYAATFMN